MDTPLWGRVQIGHYGRLSEWACMYAPVMQYSSYEAGEGPAGGDTK